MCVCVCDVRVHGALNMCVCENFFMCVRVRNVCECVCVRVCGAFNPALANTGYIRCYISCLCDQHRIYPVFGHPCT